MTHKQLNFLCSTFGNSRQPESERWKCIKYIYIEKPLIDIQSFLNKGEVIYINNESVGPGFYIMGKPNADFGINDSIPIVTFIPIDAVDKVTLILSELDTTFGNELNIDFTDENDPNKFMINNNEIDDRLILSSKYINMYPEDNEFMTIVG